MTLQQLLKHYYDKAEITGVLDQTLKAEIFREAYNEGIFLNDTYPFTGNYASEPERDTTELNEFLAGE
jgi:hypothetical protein